MSYFEIRYQGKIQDYLEFNDGSFTEVWELKNDIYLCLWLPGNITNFPSTITKFK